MHVFGHLSKVLLQLESYQNSGGPVACHQTIAGMTCVKLEAAKEKLTYLFYLHYRRNAASRVETGKYCDHSAAVVTCVSTRDSFQYMRVIRAS